MWTCHLVCTRGNVIFLKKRFVGVLTDEILVEINLTNNIGIRYKWCIGRHTSELSRISQFVIFVMDDKFLKNTQTQNDSN